MKPLKLLVNFRSSWLIVIVVGAAINMAIKPISNQIDANAENNYFGNKRYQVLFVIKQDTQEIIGSFSKDEVYSGLAFFSSDMIMVENYSYPKSITNSAIEFKDNYIDKIPLDSLFPGRQNTLINSALNYYQISGNAPELPEPTMPYGYLFNLKKNKQLRIIPRLDGSGFYILSVKNKLKATIEHPDLGECQKLDFATLRLNKSKTLLVVQGQYQIFTYRLSPNYTYYFRYLLRPAIFVLILIFIRIIEILQIKQVKKQERMNQELMSLQLKSVNNQIDPHFTFNILSAVTGFDWEKDNPDEMKNFIYNSLNLFRAQLSFSNETSLTLTQEIKFVEEYVRIQQFRFPNIQLKIQIDPNLNPEIQIPKTLIYTHAENAVKHGLRPKPDGGLLSIDVVPVDKGIEITIADNGIGRPGAIKAGTTGTGTGLRTNDQIIELYSKLNQTIIEQEFEELFNPTGTKVKVRILMK